MSELHEAFAAQRRTYSPEFTPAFETLLVQRRVRARRKAAVVAVTCGAVLGVAGLAGAATQLPLNRDELSTFAVDGSPAPSPGPAGYEESQVAACREVQLALHGLTPETVGDWPPLAGEGADVVFAAQKVLQQAQERLTEPDQELAWQARFAINQLIIGDQEPSPFADLEAVKLQLAEGCGEAVPHLLPPVQTFEEAQRRFNPTNDPSVVITENDDGTYRITRRDFVVQPSP